jgi:uncharacterized SAM-binding protein YcdF (DUF218 family)
MAFKRKKKLVPFLLPAGIAGAAGCVIFLFLRAGALLVVNDPVPASLDVVFTFAGENPRISYSRKLTNQFPEAHWVLSDYHHFFSRILQRDGFSMTRVTFLDTSTNTLSEVNGLKDWINSHRDSLAASRETALQRTAVVPENKPLRVGLVSNPFHMRRIKLMAQSVFRDTAIHIYYLPVPLDQYHWTPQDVDRWWQSKSIRTWVASETGKLVAFWFFS